jgi:hypothetical protein
MVFGKIGDGAGDAGTRHAVLIDFGSLQHGGNLVPRLRRCDPILAL